MRPSAREIIEGIAWALDKRVAPHATEPWAASSLRSIRGLLQHLAERVEIEGPLLAEDNADLRGVLAGALDRLGENGAAWAALAPEVRAILDRAWRDPAAYPTVASLTEENEALSALVEWLIHALHADGLDDLARAATIAAVREYLARQAERERPLYVPAFTGPPY